MKKFFTLLAVAAMAITASAQVASGTITPGGGVNYDPVTWVPEDGFTNEATKMVMFPGKIFYTFLDNTGKSAAAPGEGTWVINKAGYIAANQNGCEIQLNVLMDGTFTVEFSAELAISKTLNMEICNSDGEIIGTMDATLPDGTQVKNAVKLEDQDLGVIAQNTPISYDVKKYTTYKFYANGTKYRVASLTFTPAEPQSAIETIAADENAPVEYYNLQGQRVAEPTQGLVIRRQGNKVEKVVL